MRVCRVRLSRWRPPRCCGALVVKADKQEDQMGLAERRAVESFKNDDFPGWRGRIDRAAGFEVPVEVDWAQLAVSDYASSYPEFFVQVYFQPLVDALKAITIDELGTTALRDGLTKIVVCNSGEFSGSRGITFVDGVLTLDHQPHVNVDYAEERTKALQQTLEAGL